MPRLSKGSDAEIVKGFLEYLSMVPAEKQHFSQYFARRIIHFNILQMSKLVSSNHLSHIQRIAFERRLLATNGFKPINIQLKQ